MPSPFYHVFLSDSEGILTLSLRRGMGTEEESKDPGAASSAMLHQGVLPGMFFRELPDAAWLPAGTFAILRLARAFTRGSLRMTAVHGIAATYKFA